MVSETRLRTFLKAASWQFVGLVTTTVMALALTGSFAEAGGFALSSAVVGLVCYCLHERVWLAISWGMKHGHHPLP